MTVKAVIFDMDGVIVDSEPIESLAWEKVLAKYGKKPLYHPWGLIHSPGEPTINGIIEKYNFPKEELELIRVLKRNFFEAIVSEGIKPLLGMPQLIKKLKKAKIKIGVASGRNEKQVLAVIKELHFDEFFDQIVGFSEEVKRKPAPDVYLKAASLLKVKTSDCMAIEDTENGVAAAKAAGMKVIAVPNKWTKHQDFSQADKIIKNLSEITMPLLKSL